MSDDESALRSATIADLRALLDKAKHPTERERLAEHPEAALRQAGLRPTQAAADFLRSLGKTRYDDTAQAAKPAKGDPMKGGAGET